MKPGDEVIWRHEMRGGYGFIECIPVTILDIHGLRARVAIPRKDGGIAEQWVHLSNLRPKLGSQVEELETERNTLRSLVEEAGSYVQELMVREASWYECACEKDKDGGILVMCLKHQCEAWLKAGWEAIGDGSEFHPLYPHPKGDPK